jgi:hypothetical protein
MALCLTDVGGVWLFMLLLDVLHTAAAAAACT